MRILSWNIQWGCGCDRRVDFDRVASVIRAHDPDVVCLQEVAVNHPELPGSRGEDQVAELAARLVGYSPHYAVGTDLPADGGQRRWFGNLMLSRLPVREVFRHSLPWPADPTCPNMPRVALEAVVETADGSLLRVLTTHLEYHSAAQRAAQVQGLRGVLAEAAGHAQQVRPDADADAPFKAHPRPAAAVLCGDFNCPPEAPEYQALLRPASGFPGLLDAWRIARPDAPHAHTVGLHGCDWPDHPYCCDYFFLSPEVAPRLEQVGVDQQTAASDHQPIWLVLR